MTRDKEINQLTLGSMSPHPSREYLILRSWRKHGSICRIFECSVKVQYIFIFFWSLSFFGMKDPFIVFHKEAVLIGDIRAVCLSSIWTIEKSSDFVTLTHSPSVLNPFFWYFYCNFIVNQSVHNRFRVEIFDPVWTLGNKRPPPADK